MDALLLMGLQAWILSQIHPTSKSVTLQNQAAPCTSPSPVCRGLLIGPLTVLEPR